MQVICKMAFLPYLSEQVFILCDNAHFLPAVFSDDSEKTSGHANLISLRLKVVAVFENRE